MPAALLILVLLLAFPSAAAGAWNLPADAPLSRAFHLGENPYAGGQHRGVDFRATPGAPVRAPCAGRVVVAGRVGTSGGVVTVLCGRWRVSVLPLATFSVRRGQSVSARTRLGTLAASADHAGLHLGVRRDGTRFGYVDPLRFLEPTRPAAPPPLGRAPRGRPPAPRPAPAAAPRPAPLVAPRPAPVAAPRPAPLAAPRPAPLAAADGLGDLAPWPAWAGLGLGLAGLGTGLRVRRWTGRRLGREAAVPVVGR